ncbi:uncharacterized protein LOC113562300 [Ooceraea biroi]|uniref:Uncharacterized protein n=1 Tax=Ooceraea biroi TaxID=2015173 RepID=A0A026W894_OOCBI|nr:uncharacterized protein LOC113562300 [Ooceraea biroi]EZA52280.1 hypothetical protein X777_08950 [Ooceraea biroi]
MWWEILPAAFITSLVTFVPQYATWYLNILVFGNPMRRDMSKEWDRNMFTRDSRIDGAPWKNRGLANIPDDDE